MQKARKPSPTESPLLIAIDPEPLPENLTAMGGECFDDFQRLREDPGLSGMIGHGIPSGPEGVPAARLAEWLEAARTHSRSLPP